MFKLIPIYHNERFKMHTYTFFFNIQLSLMAAQKSTVWCTHINLLFRFIAFNTLNNSTGNNLCLLKWSVPYSTLELVEQVYFFGFFKATDANCQLPQLKRVAAMRAWLSDPHLSEVLSFFPVFVSLKNWYNIVFFFVFL